MGQFSINRFKTEHGIFQVVFSSRGIYRIMFPGNLITDHYSYHELPWSDIADDFNRYFSGDEVNWDSYPLDKSGYRLFTEHLLDQVYLIPKGQVCTYKEIAARAGYPKACRAAGQALKANRHPIIVPCHRVVGSADIGGFSGPAGWKEMLLQLEEAW